MWPKEPGEKTNLTDLNNAVGYNRATRSAKAQ